MRHAMGDIVQNCARQHVSTSARQHVNKVKVSGWVAARALHACTPRAVPYTPSIYSPYPAKMVCDADPATVKAAIEEHCTGWLSVTGVHSGDAAVPSVVRQTPPLAEPTKTVVFAPVATTWIAPAFRSQVIGRYYITGRKLVLVSVCEVWYHKWLG